MPRQYKRKVDDRRKRKYTEEDFCKAVSAIQKKGLSLRKAASKFKVPKSTLSEHMAKSSPSKFVNLGRKTALSSLEEKVLVDLMTECAKWGFPLKIIDVRTLVKEYLDSIPKKVPQFKKNLPGEEWGRAFMKRHPELSRRFAENIKRSRATVTPTEITKYFEELKVSLEGVEPENIVNYDETAFVDDPGRQQFVFRLGQRRAENVMDHSKTSTTVMFAVAGNGTLLPPYVVYKSLNLYSTWILSGPIGTAYNRTAETCLRTGSPISLCRIFVVARIDPRFL